MLKTALPIAFTDTIHTYFLQTGSWDMGFFHSSNSFTW